MSALWDGTADIFLRSTDVTTGGDIQFGAEVPFSAAVWVKRPTIGARVFIQGVGSPNADLGWFMECLADDTLRAYRSSGAGDARGPGLAAAVWQHLAIVHDPAADLVWAYVNGVGTSAASGGTQTENVGTGGYTLGYDQNAAALTFTGNMADAAVWNDTLLPQEIKSMANGLSAKYIRPTALCRYSDLDQNVVSHRPGAFTATGVTFQPFQKPPYITKETQRAVDHRPRIRGQR